MTRKMTAKPSASASAQWWAGKYRLSYGTVKPLTAGYKDVRFDPDGGAKSLGRINYTITREGTRSFIGHSELDCNGTKNWLDFKIPFKVYTESTERSTYIDLGKSVASCQSLVLRLVAGESDPEYAGQTLATYKIR